MYKTTLVRADIKGGERVVSALEASGLKIAAAFWSNKEDEDEPPEPFDSWWDRIKILSPVSLIYRRLKERAGTGNGPVRPGWAIDSYIYKLE